MDKIREMMLDKVDFHEFVYSITDILEMKDYYTRGHSNRVAEYAELTAEMMRTCKTMKDIIHIAGHLHDIGKIGIKDSILNKKGRLTEEEYGIIKKHSENGYNILIKVKGLEKLAKIVRGHHERWDGFGYPDKLSGEKIPIEASVIAVCDTFDALTSERIYREKLNIDEALDIIAKEKWKQFDGDIVEIFIETINKNRDKIQEILVS